MSCRSPFSLKGKWRFQPDPNDIGEKEGWSNVSHDRSDWMTVEVPSNWDFYKEEFRGYEGVGWYERVFKAEESWRGKAVSIRFEGANHLAKVWLNGRYIGSHEGGYTPFEFLITDFLNFENENVLIVRVENLLLGWRVPDGACGWWNYGGIYRDVGLVITSPVRLSDVFVKARPLEDNNGALEVDVEISNHSQSPSIADVEVSVLDGSQRVVLSKQDDSSLVKEVNIPAGKTVKTVFSSKIPQPTLWSPDNPYLYQLVASVRDRAQEEIVDKLSVFFGVRSIAVRGDKLLLNNSELRIRGVNRHEEYPESGKVDSGGLLKKDLEMIKDLGANMVRACHYPNGPELYDLTDRMGLLVFSEIPLYFDKSTREKISDPRTVSSAKKQLEEMIRRDRNHPSIIIWSVANEVASDVEEGRKTIKELIETARQLDTSRIITFASNRGPFDLCFDLSDLISINEYEGWYSKGKAIKISDLPVIDEPLNHLLEKLHEKHPDKPVLVSEFGADGMRGIKGDFRWGELFQAEFIKRHWDIIKSKPFVTGGLIWCFSDYMGPKRQKTHSEFSLNDPFCLSGLVDRHRRPKKSYEVVKEMFSR